MAAGEYSIAGWGLGSARRHGADSPFSTPRSNGRLSSADGKRTRLGFEAAVEKLQSMLLAREGIWDLFKDHDTCSALGIVCASDQSSTGSKVVLHVIAGSPADLRWVFVALTTSGTYAYAFP